MLMPMAQRHRWSTLALRATADKPSPDTLDDLFLTHYAALLSRARQLVGRDRHAAEDLVHDVYVRLALRHLDVGAVENVEAYLFTTLRNVHLSQVRRRMSRVAATVSIVDYESAVSGLRSVADTEERHRAYEALSQVVRYACLRKATSRAASVLILRFFHGYYPAEIARVVRATEAAVAERLRIARAEARACLADPGRLRSLDSRPLQLPADTHPQDDAASVRALREAIFGARTGWCLSDRVLDRLYADRTSDAPDVATLAHLASCAACLDSVNLRLGLPLLAARDVSDNLGRGGPSGGGRGGGAGRIDLTSLLRTRLADAREDHPQELQAAVNGLFVGAQAVSGPLNEQRLKILVTEQVGFIEIFDEHDTCLLYLDVEPPPHGPVEQTACVALSDGRRLSASLTYSEASPTLHVAYDNPNAAREQSAVVEPIEGTADVSRALKAWSLWPVPLRFVLAGVIVGVLLANPSQTLAAAEHARRVIVDSVVYLLEKMRSRPVLPSRLTTSPAGIAPFALRAVRGAPLTSARPTAAADAISDVELSATTLEALRLLDGVGALTMEQVAVARAADRRVHVEGVVDTEARRRELTAVLRALSARHVRVDLIAIDSAARRVGTGPPSTNRPLRSAELTQDRVPAAYEHVRRSVVARAAAHVTAAADPAANPAWPTAPAADAAAANEVHRTSAALLSRSLQARLHGRTVRALVASVSPADAGLLPSTALTTWRELVGRHVELFHRETTSLRRELEQVFPPLAADDDAAVTNATPDGDVWQIAARVFELASAHDVAVRRAFAVAADGHESLEAGTPGFRRSLLEAERLAEALLTAMQGASSF